MSGRNTYFRNFSFVLEHLQSEGTVLKRGMKIHKPIRPRIKHWGRNHCVLKTLKICTFSFMKTNKSPLVLWVKDWTCNYINFIKIKIKLEKVSSGFSIFCIHVMSLESAHDSLVIKYDIVSQEGNPPPSGLADGSSSFSHSVHSNSASVPWRDLWSFPARSGPALPIHSWWGPRERRGTGSGRCMSSLDTANRNMSVIKAWKEAEGLNMGQSTLEAWVTLGDQWVTFQQGSILRALNHTHFLSCSSEKNNTLMASRVCFGVMFSLLCLFLLIVNGLWLWIEVWVQFVHISKLWCNEGKMNFIVHDSWNVIAGLTAWLARWWFPLGFSQKEDGCQMAKCVKT